MTESPKFGSEEKLDELEQLRLDGNEKLKAGEVKAALATYHHVLLAVKDGGQFSSGRRRVEVDAKRKRIETATHVNMALCHERLVNWNRAYDCAQAALKLEPNHAKAKFIQCKAMIGRGEIATAVRELRALHAKTQDDAIAKLVNEEEAKLRGKSLPNLNQTHLKGAFKEVIPPPPDSKCDLVEGTAEKVAAAAKERVRSLERGLPGLSLKSETN